MYATPYPISWITFILGSEPSYTDKLLEFRWVQILADLFLYCYEKYDITMTMMTIKLILSRLLI